MMRGVDLIGPYVWMGSWWNFLWLTRRQRWVCLLRYTLFEFSRGQLGDYGYFTGSEKFYFKGNIFVDIKSLISEADTVPRQHRVTTENLSRAVPANSAQSLPRNPAFNSLLASLSSKYPNAYLVTMIVRCAPESETMCTCLTIVSDSCISFQI